MRVSISTRLSAICALAATLAVSSNASAHYYAVFITAVTNGDADDGDFIDIQTDTLHSTCNTFTKNFVTHEMWYGMDPHMTNWVEVGFLDGADPSAGCQTTVLFWADQRNGGGFHIHYPGNSWSFGDWYSLQISAAGSCAWNVFAGGAIVGTSTANCPSAGRALEAGIESTSQTTGSAKGYLTAWWEQNGSGNWQQAWDNAYIEWNGQPFIQWLNNFTETEEVLNESF
jgi:hypothetical protein